MDFLITESATGIEGGSRFARAKRFAVKKALLRFVFGKGGN
jgi:hypothetical protein